MVNKIINKDNICNYRDYRKTFITEEKKIKRYSEDFKINVLGWYLEVNSIRGIERKLEVSDTSIINWIRNTGIIVKNKIDKAKNIINESIYNNNIKK